MSVSKEFQTVGAVQDVRKGILPVKSPTSAADILLVLSNLDGLGVTKSTG